MRKNTAALSTGTLTLNGFIRDLHRKMLRSVVSFQPVGTFLRDTPSLKVENQSNCCCMKRGSAEVDSNPAPVLPLVEDPSRVLQSIVKNINWAAEGHPSHWVGHDLGACEDFTWRSLESGGWCFIVTIAACDCCIWPHVGSNGFLPSVLSHE